MTDGDSIQAELESAEQAIAEHRTLTARRDTANQRLTASEKSVVAARARLEHEAADVAGLEGFSVSRIWSGLRGTRLTDLEREQAEQQAAAYAVAAAVAERDTARREVDDADSRLRGLGDVEARRSDALLAKENWLRGQDRGLGIELDALAAKIGAAREHQRQVSEAKVAAKDAASRLAAAQDKLGSARSWSTYDTFFGGGMIADMAKHARIDEATDLIRGADQALKQLGAELADVGLPAVGGVEINNLTKTFDVWFDNIFSDFAVRDRIQNAAARVAEARNAVDGVRAALRGREAATATELERLVANREKLLLRE